VDGGTVGAGGSAGGSPCYCLPASRDLVLPASHLTPFTLLTPTSSHTSNHHHAQSFYCASTASSAFAFSDAEAAALTAAAFKQRSFNSGYRLAHARARLHVERARQLHALRGPCMLALMSGPRPQQQQGGGMGASGSGVGAGGGDVIAAAREQIKGRQEEALRCAEAVAAEAIGVFEVAAVAEFENESINALRELVRELPALRRALGEDEGAREQLQALAAALQGPSGFVGDVASLLTGHVYTCPNGHLYVIGECGGAMAEGSCPECGARIGGLHHQLNPTNRRAADVVRDLQARAGL